MNIKKVTTSHYDNWVIPVEYLVLHYTAVDIKDTLAIFTEQGGVVSAHIVIDVDGSIYELVDCLDGRALRARHAGPSRWQENKRVREKFNDFAIGIELVNYNGNIFPFSDAQYDALTEVLACLQQHYPKLTSPERILGHEHIAGYRGKADPGVLFDWNRLYASCFSEKKTPLREAVCSAEFQASLMRFKKHAPADREGRSEYWQSVSHVTETAIKLIHEAAVSNMN